MTFTKNEVWECYQFARQMRGKHNRSMIMDRDDWEIFRDDLRGKLGEIALRNYIMKNIPNANIESNIDFSVTPLGQWDITDLIVNGKYINVKSVKGNSRFLLIETKRYDPDGSYAYRNNVVLCQDLVQVKMSFSHSNLPAIPKLPVDTILQNHRVTYNRNDYEFVWYYKTFPSIQIPGGMHVCNC